MKLGDVFEMLPACNLPDKMNHYMKKNPPKKLTGRVVYIHPQRRWAHSARRSFWRNFPKN